MVESNGTGRLVVCARARTTLCLLIIVVCGCVDVWMCGCVDVCCLALRSICFPDGSSVRIRVRIAMYFCVGRIGSRRGFVRCCFERVAVVVVVVVVVATRNSSQRLA